MFGSKQKKSQILVLIVALNEEHGIGPTIKDLKRFSADSDFLVLDGRSVDKTVEIAKKFGVTVKQQLGYGKGDAIAQGIRSSDFFGDYVVMIDADFTYSAKFIPEMVKILEKNSKVGMVCGNRFNDKYSPIGMNKMFFIGNRILAFIHNLLNRVRLNDPLSGLRVVRWDLIRNWTPQSSGFDIEVELNHFIEKRGYEIVEVPISLRPRLGKKKLNVFDGLKILKRIIMESISFKEI